MKKASDLFTPKFIAWVKFVAEIFHAPRENIKIIDKDDNIRP